MTMNDGQEKGEWNVRDVYLYPYQDEKNIPDIHNDPLFCAVEVPTELYEEFVGSDVWVSEFAEIKSRLHSTHTYSRYWRYDSEVHAHQTRGDFSNEVNATLKKEMGIGDNEIYLMDRLYDILGLNSDDRPGLSKSLNLDVGIIDSLKGIVGEIERVSRLRGTNIYTNSTPNREYLAEHEIAVMSNLADHIQDLYTKLPVKPVSGCIAENLKRVGNVINSLRR